MVAVDVSRAFFARRPEDACIYLRGLQGFLAAFLLALCTGHFSTKTAGTDIPLMVELAMIAVVVLLLAWLQKLSRIPAPVD